MWRALLVGGFLGATLLAACSTADSAQPTSANANATQADAGAVSTIPTFATYISSIVQNRCQSCHQTGGIAPFSLVTYDDVKSEAALSNLRIQSRDMPPWGAYDDDACTMTHAFQDDLRMTDAERATFQRWVAAGMPQGDMSAAPPAKTDFGNTTLANVTDTFSIPTVHTVLGNGKDDIRCFPIQPNLTADAWVGGVNVVPGDPRVVHHVIVYVDPKNEGPAKSAAAAAADPTITDGSYPCFGGPTTSSPSILVAWAPGVPPMSFGTSAGLKVAKGAGLVMQVHYHATNVDVQDQTKFELARLPSVPDQVAQIILAGNAEDAAGTNTGGLITLMPGPDDPATGPAFFIPSNVKGHTETMVLTLPATIDGFPLPQLKLGIVGAHMHWAGTNLSMQIERANPPAGQPAQECLLGTPKYNFNWQRGYVYADTPDKLPTVNAGDKITIKCTYDNTLGNPLIARALVQEQVAVPPALSLGETTFDEMCLGVLVLLRDKTFIDN